MDRNLNGEDVNESVPSAPPGHVRKVKETWQQFEDYGLANKLQNEEFNQHFEHNRHERRLMHGDIRVSKEEQQQEDKFSAEYYEQLRRDRERDDERIAMEIQRRLEREAGLDMNSKRARELEDEMLARRLQEMEVAQQNSAGGPSAAPVVVAGPTNGLYRPLTQRHASIPTDTYGQRIPPGAAMQQESRWNYSTGSSQNSHATSASSAASKRTPPPRPPPPRHNSLR